MPNFDPCTDKAEQAFHGFLTARNAAALADYQLVLAKRHAELPIPSVVFAVSEDQVRERLHGRGVFDIPLDLYVGTDSSQDPEAAAHTAAVGAVIAELNDKSALRLALNAHPTPWVDARAVRDFHVYDYSLRGQPTRTVAHGIWETVIKLLVICQGMDNPHG